MNFLNQVPLFFQKKPYKKIYTSGLKKFLEWYGKTVEEVLQERKDDQFKDSARTLLLIEI